MQQGSEEWFGARLGQWTASEMHRLVPEHAGEYVVVERKKDYAVMREGAEKAVAGGAGLTADEAVKLCDQLNAPRLPKTADEYILSRLAERWAGERAREFIWQDRERGHQLEPAIIERYSREQGVFVEAEGFVPWDGLDHAGASPDGLIGLDGALEAKAPRPWKHLERILHGLDHDYLVQAQAVLGATHRDWLVHVSYCPYFDAPLDWWQIHINREQEQVNLIRGCIPLAEARLAQYAERIRTLTGANE